MSIRKHTQKYFILSYFILLYGNLFAQEAEKVKTDSLRYRAAMTLIKQIYTVLYSTLTGNKNKRDAFCIKFRLTNADSVEYYTSTTENAFLNNAIIRSINLTLAALRKKGIDYKIFEGEDLLTQVYFLYRPDREQPLDDRVGTRHLQTICDFNFTFRSKITIKM